jgi:hypothetical protein
VDAGGLATDEQLLRDLAVGAPLDPGLVAGLILFEPAKPSGTQREVAASTYVGPALAAAAQGDVSRAFTSSCAAWAATATGRSCGPGSGTTAWPRPNASRPPSSPTSCRQLAPGPSERPGTAALRSPFPPLVPREPRHPGQDAARCAHTNPARAGSPRPTHPPRRTRRHHRRLRPPPSSHALLTSSAPQTPLAILGRCHSSDMQSRELLRRPRSELTPVRDEGVKVAL